MNAYPATKRSIALVIALAILSVVCLAIALRAEEKAKPVSPAASHP